MKDKITLFDKETGKALTIGTEDGFNENLVLMLPNKNGTLALVEDVEEIQKFLQGDELIASDSLKLGGKTSNMYLLSDLSNVDLDNLSTATLSGLKGYTGSSGTNGITGYTGSKGSDGTTGIAGPIGPQGYTGSKGTDGINGYTGSIGYTGSAGTNGTVSTAAPSGGVNGDTWFQY